jgi:hypothetical protein
MSYFGIAKKYGISQGHAHRIVHRKAWPHVT